jgi:hypothetical protein
MAFDLGILAFAKVYNKDNFQSSSKEFCIPCSTTSADGSISFMNADGRSVQCKNVGDWLNSDDGKQSLTNVLNSLGADIDVDKKTFGINGNAKTSTNATNAKYATNAYVLRPEGSKSGFPYLNIWQNVSGTGQASLVFYNNQGNKTWVAGYVP